jgi:uncharacterized protein DUF4232
MPRHVVNAILRPLDHPLGFAARFAATGLAATLLLALAYGSTALRPAASTGTTPACTLASLGVRLGRDGAAAGSVYYPLVFTDLSGRSCTLYGYPGVSFIWPDGRQAGRAASRAPSAASVVTIAPGGAAHATVQVADALAYPIAMCIPVVVRRLKVYPPGSRTALVIPLSTVTCSRRMPLWLGSPLVVSAVTGGA